MLEKNFACAKFWTANMIVRWRRIPNKSFYSKLNELLKILTKRYRIGYIEEQSACNGSSFLCRRLPSSSSIPLLTANPPPLKPSPWVPTSISHPGDQIPQRRRLIHSAIGVCMNLIFKASVFYQLYLHYTIFSKSKYNAFQLSSLTHTF